VSTIELKAGDSMPPLEATLTDGQGVPVSLAGATLTMRLRRPDGTTVTRAATIVEAAEGAVLYQWEAGDITKAGNYDAEFVATYAAGARTFPSRGVIRIRVEAGIS
jgi:hypothetical protein